MSRKIDISDLSKLTEDELRYAFDRYLISEDEFLAASGSFTPQESDEDEEDETYESMTVAQLREELGVRNIEMKASATKAEIIAALEADDEENAD